MKLFSSIRTAAFSFVILFPGFSSLRAQEQQSKNVTLSRFSEISISTGLDLVITRGDTESARIVATENLIDAVVVEQAGNKINIKWKLIQSQKKAWLNRKATIYMTYKTLNFLEASSGSSLKTENTLKTDHLDAIVSSGAIIKADIDCGKLELKTSSGASASLSGKATEVKMESSSGSRVNALELVSDYATVNASTGAAIRINVNKSLEPFASTGGRIRYTGNADLKNFTGSKNGVRKLE